MKTFNELYSLYELSLKDYLNFAKKITKGGLSLAKGAVGATSAALRAPETIGKGVYKSVVGNEPVLAQTIQRGIQKASDALGNTSSGRTEAPRTTKQQDYVELELSPELMSDTLKRGDTVTGITKSINHYGRKRVSGKFLGRSDKGVMVANPSYV